MALTKMYLIAVGRVGEFFSGIIYLTSFAALEDDLGNWVGLRNEDTVLRVRPYSVGLLASWRHTTNRALDSFGTEFRKLSI